jgi:hypothetical protein
MEKIVFQAIILLVAVATLNSQYVLPSGGEDGYGWSQGSTQVISWSKYFMDTTRSIDILLWNADAVTYSIIATNIPVRNEYYLWAIPLKHPIGGKFKIKIVYHNGFLPQFKYVSNGFFSIKEPSPPVQIPNIITKRKTNSFKIFPNPTDGIINIESDSKFFGVEIYNIEGSLVFNRRFNYTNHFNLTANLPQGTYTVLVRFMGSTATEQLFIRQE